MPLALDYNSTFAVPSPYFEQTIGRPVRLYLYVAVQAQGSVVLELFDPGHEGPIQIQAGQPFYRQVNCGKYRLTGAGITITVIQSSSPFNPGQIQQVNAVSPNLGNGSDGAAVLDGTTGVAWATLAGGTYSMVRNAQLTNLTVDPGVTLVTNSYMIQCTGTFLNSGTVQAGPVTSGGSTGAGANATPTVYGYYPGGGGGAGGEESGPPNVRGYGGGGAGIVWIAAHDLFNGGTISAIGGNGGVGGASGGIGAGGGGGGGGGVIALFYVRAFTAGTTSVAGGSGGAGSSDSPGASNITGNNGGSSAGAAGGTGVSAGVGNPGANSSPFGGGGGAGGGGSSSIGTCYAGGAGGTGIVITVQISS